VSDEDHFLEYQRVGRAGEAEGGSQVGWRPVSFYLVSSGD
jgi:hypothetical protein